jgi:glucosylceramidase
MSHSISPRPRTVCLATLPAAGLLLACLQVQAQNVTVAQTAQNQTTSAFNPTVDMVQPLLNFAPGSAASVNATINVDNTGGYQQIDGFGPDFGDLTVNLIANPAAGVNGVAPMTPAQQTSFLKSLFLPTTGYDPTAGYGFNLMLVPIGANAEVYHGCYNNPTGTVAGCGTTPEGTYDDNNGVVDTCLYDSGNQLVNFATPCDFSIANSYHSDLTYLIPGIQSSLTFNPGLHVIGSATYQPNWMMATDPSPCGTAYTSGQTVTTISPTYYQTAANYYTKYVQTYESYGIPIWALTPMNEPCIPAADQPGDLTPVNAVNLLKNFVYPTFKAAKLNTQLLPEVNNYTDTSNYPTVLMQDPVLASEVLGIAWHGYNGTVNNAVNVVGADATITQTNGNRVHVNQYQSEVGGTAVQNDAAAFDYRAYQPMAGLQQGEKTWMWNSLANNSADNAGNCNGSGTGSCYPLVLISSTGTVTQLQPSYIMKHYSRYIHPGAYIVNSTSVYPAYSLAARNPDGSTVLVVVNYDETDASRTVGINWGGRTFSYTLPQYSMATFLWPGIQNASNTEVDDATQGTAANQLNYSGSGWAHGTSCGTYTGCYGTTVSTDSTSGDSVTMSFQGTYVNVYGGALSGGGTANIWVDSGAVTSVNEASPTVAGNPAVYTIPAGDALLYATPAYAPLSTGAHTLHIQNTSNAPFMLDRIEVVTPTTVTVDDAVQGTAAAQFNYVGSGWTHCTSCDTSPAIGKYAGSSSTDSTAGDSVSFSYTGYGVTLYLATGPAQGYANVTFDTNPAVRIDTYANTAAGNQVGWISPPVTTAGQHTVTVTVAGSQGAYSSGGAVTIDRHAGAQPSLPDPRRRRERHVGTHYHSSGRLHRHRHAHLFQPCRVCHLFHNGPRRDHRNHPIDLDRYSQCRVDRGAPTPWSRSCRATSRASRPAALWGDSAGDRPAPPQTLCAKRSDRPGSSAASSPGRQRHCDFDRLWRQVRRHHRQHTHPAPGWEPEHLGHRDHGQRQRLDDPHRGRHQLSSPPLWAAERRPKPQQPSVPIP